MKENYSPSDFKQNTWEYDDDEEEPTQIDLKYEMYRRVYLWDLDEPLSLEEFKQKLQEDENFRAVWGPRDDE